MNTQATGTKPLQLQKANGMANLRSKRAKKPQPEQMPTKGMQPAAKKAARYAALTKGAKPVNASGLM